jgi:GNAT superfamily N-acetyltransferase
MDVVQRLQRWHEQFPHRVVSGLLVANVKKNAAGFVCFGNARDQGRRDWGEIYAIYVLESYRGNGLGYQLYKHACAELRHDDVLKSYLWVLNKTLEPLRLTNGGADSSNMVASKTTRSVVSRSKRYLCILL